MVQAFRQGAAVITAVAIVLGISGAVVWLIAAALIEPETGIAFLGPTYGGAATFLFVKASAKDAANTALAQPGTDTEVAE